MMEDLNPKDTARYTVTLIGVGLLLGGIASQFGSTETAAILAIPLGLALGYNACISVHGDAKGIKSYPYVVGGLIITTLIQYSFVM